jgi:hypothetical protein
MSITHCDNCDRWIDEDYDVEHLEECGREPEELLEILNKTLAEMKQKGMA